MTSNMKLPPLPPHDPALTQCWSGQAMQDYARACVEANTGILEAKMEIWKAKAMFHVELSEALRAEVERLNKANARLAENCNTHFVRAEQLAEACRDVEEAWTGNGDMATAVDKVLLALHPTTAQEIG